MKDYKIAVIPGDGTGPEVVNEGLKVLKAVSEKCGFKYSTETFDFGGERYLRTKEVLPESAVSDLQKFDTIFLGAIGHPDVKPGILEKGILLKLRFDLNQYINLRPIKLYDERFCPLKGKTPADIDFVVVRENSEGLYKGLGEFQNKDTADEIALQISHNTRKGVERCLKYAFEYTQKYGKKKELTMCGKTNVLTYAWDLWERTFNQLATQYPEVKTNYTHVDATTMWFVKNPEWFDVIVTDNMFGDIITDLGAMIQGGMGLAAGGNINPEGVSMFEPIGGSAPKYTGKNVINPMAAICAMSMLLKEIGEDKASEMVENSVKEVVTTKLKSVAAGKMGYSTSEVGDLVVKHLK